MFCEIQSRLKHFTIWNDHNHNIVTGQTESYFTFIVMYIIFVSLSQLLLLSCFSWLLSCFSWWSLFIQQILTPSSSIQRKTNQNNSNTVKYCLMTVLPIIIMTMMILMKLTIMIIIVMMVMITMQRPHREKPNTHKFPSCFLPFQARKCAPINLPFNLKHCSSFSPSSPVLKKPNPTKNHPFIIRQYKQR